jgi:hypothetical protein
MNDSPAASIAFWLGDHPCVRDDGDVGQPVGGHGLLDDRQHRLGLA